VCPDLRDNTLQLIAGHSCGVSTLNARKLLIISSKAMGLMQAQRINLWAMSIIRHGHDAATVP
jgi:hypothetical protein